MGSTDPETVRAVGSESTVVRLAGQLQGLNRKYRRMTGFR